MKRFYIILLLMTAGFVLAGCASSAASAEEYFSIGMAYFDMGQNSTGAAAREKNFQEAEKWLNRAKAVDKTMSASEYNLGRIAFETGRYEDAVKHFESVLKRDPENVLALRAAAYTRIRMGDIEKASVLYDRLLALVPESADDGYNHALVLFAMKRYAEAEQVLKSHEFALLDNKDVLLLYARAQKEQGKVEAIDTYASWLANNTDAKVRYEYAQLLEGQELYARALDEYRGALTGLTASNVDPSKPEVRFAIARLLLIADSEKPDGVTELQGAVTDGFENLDEIEKLLLDERISAANRESIRTVVTEKKRAAEADKNTETPDNGETGESAGTAE